MATILDKIVERKHGEVAEARARTPQTELEARVEGMDPARDFFGALVHRQESGTTRVIAEVKRKSPSAGMIWNNPQPFDPVNIAGQYHAAGASAISCLTDEVDFGGDLEFIQAIRASVPLPVLRKDFIVDAYQVWEARAAEADAILLIAECIGTDEIVEYRDIAHSLGMSVLVEVHSEENLRKVLDCMSFPCDGRTLLGINNRDLARMQTDLANTGTLLDAVGDKVADRSVVVGESGIRTPDDLGQLRQVDVRIVLVGEHLMSQSSPGDALRALLA